jgi:hypothetical protein
LGCLLHPPTIAPAALVLCSTALHPQLTPFWPLYFV